MTNPPKSRQSPELTVNSSHNFSPRKNSRRHGKNSVIASMNHSMKKESPIRTIVIDGSEIDSKSKRNFNRSCVED